MSWSQPCIGLSDLPAGKVGWSMKKNFWPWKINYSCVRESSGGSWAQKRLLNAFGGTQHLPFGPAEGSLPLYLENPCSDSKLSAPKHGFVLAPVRPTPGIAQRLLLLALQQLLPGASSAWSRKEIFVSRAKSSAQNYVRVNWEREPPATLHILCR